MALKPWREIAVPREDVLRGTFQQAEFAADLTRVQNQTAAPEYQDPVQFFQRTFITEGMRLLLDSVVRRLLGKGGDPVIQLQTAFGGGKTHTMLAVYHIARGQVPMSQLWGVPAILDAAGATDLPQARVVVLDGINLSPSQPKQYGASLAHTMWGELACQLGGDAAYDMVKASDLDGTAPKKDALQALLAAFSPCVILMDELVAYLRQFEEGRTYTGGTFGTNLTFIQSLTEAIKAVPNAILLASLPESRPEAGGSRGEAALDALERYFGRVQALWKPVATEEAFAIVRRRLFTTINDDNAAMAVCRAFADFYAAGGDDFPPETQANRYYERLERAYPIHPEVFDRLYEDWSSLDKFQRTRGVLKLMAKIVHRLWKDDNKDYLIMPGSLPLYDPDVRNEAIYYLPQGWDPVLERDIDGEKAETTRIDSDTRFGVVQAARRAARTIFLGSAPASSNQMARGVEGRHVILGCAQPGQHVAVYRDVLGRLTDRLYYLNSGHNRLWFDIRPNLRREMEDRKRRFGDREDVFPEIRKRLQQGLQSGVFGGVHIFTQSGDVPDDPQLRLVVLPPDAPYSRSATQVAQDKALEIMSRRGEQPRQRQNRLLFLAPDQGSVGRLNDHIRAVLAWQSIVEDIKANRLLLDQLQTRDASEKLEGAKETAKRMVREAYKWLLVPAQDATPGNGTSEIRWEGIQVSPSASDFSREIEAKLRDNDLLAVAWAPVHLAKELRNWFWKEGQPDAQAQEVWQKFCCYLYFPRLKDESVFHSAITAGARTRDFFGMAYGKEGERYVGFSFGSSAQPVCDSLLLIEPGAAAAYEERNRPEPAPTPPGPGPTPPGPGPIPPGPGPAPGPGPGPTPPPSPAQKHRFYGSVDISAVSAKFQLAQIVDEVVQHFAAQHNVQLAITLDLSAESREGFTEELQRTIRENCNFLKFKAFDFE